MLNYFVGLQQDILGTTDLNNVYQGTGLGLHIVAKYVEQLNGTIHCRSELNKGTELEIIFKMADNCQSLV